MALSAALAFYDGYRCAQGSANIIQDSLAGQRQRGATAMSCATESHAYMIFGATGTQASTKLLPALYPLHCQGQLAPNVRIIGCGQTSFQRDGWRDEVRQPDEVVRMEISAKVAVQETLTRQITMNMSVGNPAERKADAYQALQIDVIQGERSLFLRYDELTSSPALNGGACRAPGQGRVEYYRSGDAWLGGAPWPSGTVVLSTLTHG